MTTVADRNIGDVHLEKLTGAVGRLGAGEVAQLDAWWRANSYNCHAGRPGMFATYEAGKA